MLEDLMPYATEIFAIVATSVVAYLAAIARQYVNAAIARTEGVLDEEARRRLETAFDNAIAAAEARGSAVTLDDVIDYVKRFNAGDLGRFNLSGKRLLDRASTAIAARKV